MLLWIDLLRFCLRFVSCMAVCVGFVNFWFEFWVLLGRFGWLASVFLFVFLFIFMLGFVPLFAGCGCVFDLLSF